VLEFFRQLVTGVAQTWRRLSISARVQLALAALLTIGLVAGAAFYGAQPQYGRLYSRLNLDEANEITVYLTEQNIPYQLRDGGTSIDIPVRDISRSRVALSAQNLPSSQGVVPGFELLDTTDLMTNRWQQDMNYQRGLRGELQKQLNQFDYIKNSFVFIREAPDELFVGEQNPSQATVTLDTTGPLRPDQVKAVLHTVTSFGGAHLAPSSVAIMTTDGTILHGPSDDTFASLAGNQLEVQLEYENAAERKIREAFEGMGVNHVVQVSAVMDWTSEEVKDRKVVDGAVISTLETTSTVRDISPTAGGPPGAVANIPEELGRPGEAGLISEDGETIENFEPSETLRTTTTRPGRVKQYKVAAYIEGAYTPAAAAEGAEAPAEGATPAMDYQALTAEQIAQYSDFIKNTVGDGTLPTEVVVFDQPFNIDRITAVEQMTMPPAPWTESTWFNWMWRIGLVALMFLVVRFLMRRALVIPAEEEEIIEIPEASPAERRQQEIAAEVERLSQQEPDTVAALLRTWMNEE
jgi:flagellar M-ring protein FliF